MNKWLIIGTAYICLLTGMTIGMVGQYPTNHESFSWKMPIEILCLIGLPFILGFLAGGNHED